MTLPGRIWLNRVWLPVALAAVLLIAAGIVLTVLSASGRALFDFAAEAPYRLAADENIAASISFDKPSYLAGDIARYRIRILWRNELVTPDLETFESSIGFFPLEHRGTAVNRRMLGRGVREYVAEFSLQAVDVDTPASYLLDTATVYYTQAGEDDTDVHSLRANPPLVHIGEFYPDDIATIGLRPLKPVIDDVRTLRRVLIGLCGIALAGILLVLLVRCGRKRPYAELSAAEQLWRDVDELRREPKDDRQHVVDYERLFTRALELRAGVAPIEFWSGRNDEAGEWHDVLVAARRTFGEAYRPEGPTAADVERIAAIIDELLAPVVEEDRLRRETHDDLVTRLRQQPAVLAASAGLALAVVIAFLLAALPSLWLPADIQRYNAAVELLADSDDVQQAVDAFTELADASQHLRVRSASLYNLGTLLADPRLARLSRDQYENFLRAIFLPEITLELLLHDMELDAEFELITLLTELTRQYVQAEQTLQAAVRLLPDDPDAGRNLELLGKLRRAISRSLARLIEQGEDSTGTQQMLSQTIIDLRLLMEAELPDDYAKLDEGKDDRDYFIMEKF